LGQDLGSVEIRETKKPKSLVPAVVDLGYIHRAADTELPAPIRAGRRFGLARDDVQILVGNEASVPPTEYSGGLKDGPLPPETCPVVAPSMVMRLALALSPPTEYEMIVPSYGFSSSILVPVLTTPGVRDIR
jgi:hypothetical protein